jgi:hypothetical protein
MFKVSFSPSFDSEEFGGARVEMDILCITYTMTRARLLAVLSAASKV